MAITRSRKVKSPKLSPRAVKGSPKGSKASPHGTPSKKADTPLKQVTEEFELPSDSDSESDSDIVTEAQQEFEDEKEQINSDIKSIITHQVKTKLNQVNNSEKKLSKSKSGIIYIGRLPRGFEEYELKKYFEQFGSILNLRVSRNKKTGNSKHYAFIEFANLEVAKIALETMNNYLIFGHIIKVSLLTKDKVEIFKESNKIFKKIPWLKISKLQNDKPKKQTKWDQLQKAHDKKRLDKLSKLKSLGINYNL